jgi:hypothetical protein
MRSLLAVSLCTAAVLAADVRAAGAQHASTPDRARPASPAALTDVVHPIVTYRFVGWRGADLPTEVSLADSAGTFVAHYRTPRTPDARPMSVDVRGENVYMIGDTPAGVLSIEFYERSRTARDGVLEGRWTLGARSGELRGRLERSTALAAPRS